MKQDDSIARVDLIFVIEELRAMGKLEEAGGSAYLMALIEACPCAANINAYIKSIRRTAKLRNLIALGEHLQDAALAPDADPDHLMAATQNTAEAISQKGYADMATIFEKHKQESI